MMLCCLSASVHPIIPSSQIIISPWFGLKGLRKCSEHFGWAAVKMGKFIKAGRVGRHAPGTLCGQERP